MWPQLVSIPSSIRCRLQVEREIRAAKARVRHVSIPSSIRCRLQGHELREVLPQQRLFQSRLRFGAVCKVLSTTRLAIRSSTLSTRFNPVFDSVPSARSSCEAATTTAPCCFNPVFDSVPSASRRVARASDRPVESFQSRLRFGAVCKGTPSTPAPATAFRGRFREPPIKSIDMSTLTMCQSLILPC